MPRWFVFWITYLYQLANGSSPSYVLICASNSLRWTKRIQLNFFDRQGSSFEDLLWKNLPFLFMNSTLINRTRSERCCQVRQLAPLFQGLYVLLTQLPLIRIGGIRACLHLQKWAIFRRLWEEENEAKILHFYWETNDNMNKALGSKFPAVWPQSNLIAGASIF